MNKPSCRTFLFAAAFAIIVISPVAHSQITSITQVKGADPQRDIALAIGKGDLRFIAVNGVAAGMVPGTDQHGADRALIEVRGTRTLRGTSDYKDLRLNQLAWEYAEAYNKLLLGHLRKKPQ
jgi:hypothetical protein